MHHKAASIDQTELHLQSITNWIHAPHQKQEFLWSPVATEHPLEHLLQNIPQL